jgi:muconolactone delta-isomerase
MAGWLAAPAGGGFDARSVTEAADEVERLRAREAARARLLLRQTERANRLQALIDAYARMEAFSEEALLAAATPKEDDRG